MDCVYCGCMFFHFSTQVWAMFGAALVLGLIFGSFLNVCILRLPVDESIVSPGSHCPACHKPVRGYDNIPLVSWLLLRGRCRDCHTKISLQYPLVELATASLFIACVLQSGAAWQTLIDAVACFFLLGLAVMDARTMLLPDRFTLSGLLLAFLLRVGAPGVQQRGHIALRTAGEAAIAAGILLLVWAIYWAIRRQHGVGMGDVKLMAMMAAFLGLPLTLFAYFAGIVTAALFAAALIAQRKAGRSDRIAFGSFLAGAGIVAIFAGDPVLHWYLSQFR